MKDEDRKKLEQRRDLLRLKVDCLSSRRDLGAEMQQWADDGLVRRELMDLVYPAEEVKQDREHEARFAASVDALRAELEEVEYRLSPAWVRLWRRLAQGRRERSAM